MSGRTEYLIGYGDLSEEFIQVSQRPSDGGLLPRYMDLYDDLFESNFVASSESLLVYNSVVNIAV